MTTEDAFFSHSGAADYMTNDDYDYRYEPPAPRAEETPEIPAGDPVAPARSDAGTIPNFELSSEDTLFGPADLTRKR